MSALLYMAGTISNKLWESCKTKMTPSLREKDSFYEPLFLVGRVSTLKGGMKIKNLK